MPRKADNPIRVTDDTWAKLNSLKRPGDTFDDVLRRLLDEAGEGIANEGNPNSPPTATASD